MTPQNKIYEAAMALISDLINKRSHFNSFQNLCRVLSEYEQSIEQPEPSLDKLAETVLREYVKFKDVNGSKSVSLLPLTIVDMMVEFIDMVNEQPEAIAAFEQSQQEGMEAITWKKNAYESALDYLSEMGYGSGTNFTSKGVASLLADFASQQTASKDKEIADLSGELHATDKLNQELQDEIAELKERISVIKEKLPDNKIRELNPIWVRDEIISELEKLI